MGQDLQKVLLTEEQIDARLTELAALIDRDYEGTDLLLVGVLNGAVMAMARTRPASINGAALLAVTTPRAT